MTYLTQEWDLGEQCGVHDGELSAKVHMKWTPLHYWTAVWYRRLEEMKAARKYTVREGRKEGRREGEKKGRREGRRGEGGRKGGREGGREGGKEGGRKGRREDRGRGELTDILSMNCLIFLISCSTNSFKKHIYSSFTPNL